MIRAPYSGFISMLQVLRVLSLKDALTSSYSFGLMLTHCGSPDPMLSPPNASYN